jgi:hypothetical protein
MNPTLRQISELSAREQAQLKANINYFMWNEYKLNKRRKQIMTARMEIENESASESSEFCPDKD